jgi:hypothetical protein
MFSVALFQTFVVILPARHPAQLVPAGKMLGMASGLNETASASCHIIYNSLITLSFHAVLTNDSIVT